MDPCTLLQSWDEVTVHLDGEPDEGISGDEDGAEVESRWIYRGVADSDYELEPAIERAADRRRHEWARLEARAVEEYRYRAPAYLEAALDKESELSWLAHMQNHGVPTRLLDFTLSPSIALFFAARDCRLSHTKTNGPKRDRSWAINSIVVTRQIRGWQINSF